MGSKIFMIGEDVKGRNRHGTLFWYLDLQHKHWKKSRKKAHQSLYCAHLASVDSFLFEICISLSHGNPYIDLVCYDVEKKTWSKRADSPLPKGAFSRPKDIRTASCVVINKDIYYVDADNFHQFCLRYSTINNEWTTLAPPSPWTKKSVIRCIVMQSVYRETLCCA